MAIEFWSRWMANTSSRRACKRTATKCRAYADLSVRPHRSRSASMVTRFAHVSSDAGRRTWRPRTWRAAPAGLDGAAGVRAPGEPHGVLMPTGTSSSREGGQAQGHGHIPQSKHRARGQPARAVHQPFGGHGRRAAAARSRGRVGESEISGPFTRRGPGRHTEPARRLRVPARRARPTDADLRQDDSHDVRATRVSPSGHRRGRSAADGTF